MFTVLAGYELQCKCNNNVSVYNVNFDKHTFVDRTFLEFSLQTVLLEIDNGMYLVEKKYLVGLC